MNDVSAPPALNCPRCGKPMDNGFVTAGKGLRFREDGRVHWTLMGGETLISMWKMAGTAAWDCPACHLAVIDYSQADWLGASLPAQSQA